MNKLLLLLFCLGACVTLTAQKNQYYDGRGIDVMQSVGVSYYQSFLTQTPAIHYQPRMNIFELSSDDAISLDVRLAAGYFEEPQDIASDYYFVFESPVFLNYNHGCGATKISSDNIGMYAGLGWNNEWAYGEYFAFGPMANAGFRFDVAATSPLDVNIGYMYDISGYYNNVFMAGISYMFGMMK